MRTIAIMVQHDYHSLTDEVMSTTVWRYIGVSEIIPNMKAQSNVSFIVQVVALAVVGWAEGITGHMGGFNRVEE